jgi:hypothetical protein
MIPTQFIGSGGLLLYIKKSADVSYHKPDKSNQRHYFLFGTDWNCVHYYWPIAPAPENDE